MLCVVCTAADDDDQSDLAVVITRDRRMESIVSRAWLSVTRDTYLCVFPPINCAGALQVARTIYTINLTIYAIMRVVMIFSLQPVWKNGAGGWVWVSACTSPLLLHLMARSVLLQFLPCALPHTPHICTLVRAYPYHCC